MTSPSAYARGVGITADVIRVFKNVCAEAAYRSYVLGGESA